MSEANSDTRTVSVVIPVKDEQSTLEELSMAILSTFEELRASFDVEIIFVDDGSTDDSWETLCCLARTYPNIITIKLRRNFGKAIGLEAGFSQTTGEIVITMDADLQDDPAEIPRFIHEIDSGFDLVSGWKRMRHDPLSKKIPSRIFNKITSWLTGIQLHDFNCGFKAYRSEVIKTLDLYGELHRYIPVLAYDKGFKIGEIEVRHHPRRHGSSKYGFERYLRGAVDLITVLATTRWLNKPNHLFGSFGILAGIIGGLILVYLTILWFAGLGPIGDRPLLLLGVMLCILSVQMISIGLIVEYLIKVTRIHENKKQILSSISEMRNTSIQ